MENKNAIQMEDEKLLHYMLELINLGFSIKDSCVLLKMDEEKKAAFFERNKLDAKDECNFRKQCIAALDRIPKEEKGEFRIVLERRGFI